jgi:hypothetical protein
MAQRWSKREQHKGTGNDRSKLGTFIPQRVILSPQPHGRPSSLACSNSHDGLARLSQKLAHFQPERLAITIMGKPKRFQEKAAQGHRRRVETSGGQWKMDCRDLIGISEGIYHCLTGVEGGIL